MTDRYCCKVIHNVLQSRDKWYLDHSVCGDEPELYEIAEKAKGHADYRLTELSPSALYGRYKRWRKEEIEVLDGDKYFTSFLSYVAFELGADALDSQEKVIYWDSCSINFIFMRQ